MDASATSCGALKAEKVLSEYKKSRAQLVESGVFKKRKSKWNQYVKDNYPIVKEALLLKAKIEGKPEPNGRELFTQVNHILALRRNTDTRKQK